MEKYKESYGIFRFRKFIAVIQTLAVIKNKEE